MLAHEKVCHMTDLVVRRLELVTGRRARAAQTRVFPLLVDGCYSLSQFWPPEPVMTDGPEGRGRLGTRVQLCVLRGARSPQRLPSLSPVASLRIAQGRPPTP